MKWRFTFIVAVSVCLIINVLNAAPAMAQKVVNARDFGAKGDGRTDDAVAINKAWDKAIKANLPLFIPAGTYIVSSNIIVPALQANSEVVLMGEGKNTILKRKDGSVSSNLSIVVFNINNASGNVNITIKDIAFDDNADKQMKPLRPYDLEHAATIRFGGKNENFLYNSFKVQNVYFYNPIADHIWINTLGKQFLANNVTATGRTRTRSDIDFSMMPQQVRITNCKMNNLESEPVQQEKRKFACSFVVQDVTLSQKLDLSGIYNVQPVTVDIENVTVQGETFLGNLVGTFTNCELHGIGRMVRNNLEFRNCRIVLPLKENSDTVMPIQIDYNMDRDPAPIYKKNSFINCSFVIDSKKPEIRGTMIESFSAQKTLDVTTVFDGCVFDNRADCNIENYRNGKYVIRNCQLGVNPNSPKACVSMPPSAKYKSSTDVSGNKILRGGYKNF